MKNHSNVVNVVCLCIFVFSIDGRIPSCWIWVLLNFIRQRVHRTAQRKWKDIKMRRICFSERTGTRTYWQLFIPEKWRARLCKHQCLTPARHTWHPRRIHLDLKWKNLYFNEVASRSRFIDSMRVCMNYGRKKRTFILNTRTNNNRCKQTLFQLPFN